MANRRSVCLRRKKYILRNVVYDLDLWLHDLVTVNLLMSDRDKFY